MKRLLFGLIFCASAALAQRLEVIAIPLLTSAPFIMNGLVLPPGAKPGYLVMIRRVDREALDADAYRVVIQYTKDGLEYERVQMTVNDHSPNYYGAQVFHIDGVITLSKATPVYWDSVRISSK